MIKKYRHYSAETLLRAYEAVKTAAKKFAVPVQTLRDRVKGYIDPQNFKTGGETVLTKEEEETLVNHVETMAQLGYGYSNIQLQHLSGERAFDMGRRKENKPLSNNWLYGFLRRWNDRLSTLNPRKLESNRARCATPEAVSLYFENLQDIISKYNLNNKPHCIYNLDETGLQPEHRPPNVIAPPNSKPQAIVSPRSTTTTLIGCVNALGNALPPFFIFKGKRYNPDLMKGASTGARGVMSDSGWSNGDIFQQYLQDHFLPHVKGQTKDDPVLLIYDGHASHVSSKLIEWAKTNNIILFVLPAHTSHLLQPLDVAIFGPFKSFYYSECALFMRQNIGQTITRYDMCELACKAYLKALTPVNIQAGFRKTGIFPFSSAIVAREKLFPSESFREDRPVEKVKAMKQGKEAVETFLQMKSEKVTSKESKDSENCKCTCKKSLNCIRPKAGGKPITEDTFKDQLEDYESKKQKQNGTNKIKVQKKQNQQKEICESPKPSTSGVHFPKPFTSDNDGNHLSHELSDSDEDGDVSDVCCVCMKKSPPNLQSLPYLKIVNWAACDKCDHWVHLTFCSKVHVVRRHSDFLCPHCVE